LSKDFAKHISKKEAKKVSALLDQIRG
jgi:hypothetical protein